GRLRFRLLRSKPLRTLVQENLRLDAERVGRRHAVRTIVLYRLKPAAQSGRMSPRSIYATDAARAWRPWGALVPVLGIVLVELPTAGVSYALARVHLLQPGDGPVGLGGWVAFLLLPFSALALVLLAWVRFVEKRSLASIGLGGIGGLGGLGGLRGLGGVSPMRTFLRGHLVGVAMVTAIVAGIWAAGAFHAGAWGRAFDSPAALGGITVLLLCFAVQSSVEEIVFRGWMLSA